MTDQFSVNPPFLSSSTCYIVDHKPEVTKFIKAKNKGALYENFAARFLNYVPIDYDILNKLALFSFFADEAFEFFKIKTTNKKIEITEKSIDNHIFTSIFLLSQNQPFIIDSINCLLAKISLKACYIFHPVLKTNRNKDGMLTEIYVEHEQIEQNQGDVESLTCIQIIGKLDQELQQVLLKKIGKILGQTDDIAAIWPSIKDHIAKFTTSTISEQREDIAFLQWLRHNFTFFGFIEFDSAKNYWSTQGAASIWADNDQEIQAITKRAQQPGPTQKSVIDLGRINCFSPIRQNSLVDYILIKKIDEVSNHISGTIIFGLYDADMQYQSLQNIPILREKLAWVSQKCGFLQSSYNADKIKIIIESLPKEALIQIDKHDLYCMSMHMLSSMLSAKLKIFIQHDISASFINILIFMPRERLTPEVHNSIKNYLAVELQGTILSESITEIVQNYSHLFITLAVKDNHSNWALEDIEQELTNISCSWRDAFHQQLVLASDEFQGAYDFNIYEAIFSYEYQYKFPANTACLDLTYLKNATNLNRAVFNLIVHNQTSFSLKIYSPNQELALSDILPAIENLGFKVLEEQTFKIDNAGEINKSWIYQFDLLTLAEISSEAKVLKTNVEDALAKMFDGSLASDSLSKLIVLAGFNWSQVKLLKALTRYLHQTGFSYGKGYVQLILIKHYTYTELLIELFWAKFSLKQHSVELQTSKTQQIICYLDNVASIAEDKVLRSIFELILAMTRTNYFQTNKDGKPKTYLSFKFDSSKVPDLSLPIPYAEIFVYSNDFEGIHLRGGKISRGGIRWSDRGEDYRIEVLGLMKAQHTKNSVIVPGGSKGGFYLLFSSDNMIPAEYMTKAVASYKNFLRGLLDITDNIVGGAVVKPAQTIIYDHDDSYIVAAADKGTSAFSDYANSVSAEYNYWLGDAFASGGSNGYDHKKIGITAKGAWISVQRHFEELGINAQQDVITVVGIGDMSGDVFGNGLLRSKTVKLVAAFNHKHIFIDPNPEPSISFDERRRLFSLPNSSWSDYNPKLLSAGGQIFERTTKSIALSLEAKKLLDLEVDEINPDDLIKAILKAKVELIWNGGIGTYIKSSQESHAKIGDKVNDNLRCDGNEIRAKVVAEGGNLGASQLGRIEYNKHGGLINTDFIDNSAGVDCSDHEVNLKIALGSAVSQGKINLEERNAILAQMAIEVEELVLQDNYKQTRAISIAQLSPIVTMELVSQQIKALEEENLLNCAVEFMPDRKELARLVVAKERLSRPENAVLVSYGKMSVYNQLLEASGELDVTNDKYFEQDLLNYFPAIMQKQFKEEILAHPLRREIILTVVTNKIINQLTGPLLNSIRNEHSVSLSEIIKAFQVVCEIFDLDNLWQSVDILSPTTNITIRIDMFTDLVRIMRRGIVWFINNQTTAIDINESISEYKTSIDHLSKIIADLLVGDDRAKFENKFNLYKAAGADAQLASKVATLDSLISCFDIINIAKLVGSVNIEVASYYFEIGNIFNLNWLRKICDKQLDDSYWNRLSVQSLKDDLYDKQKMLTFKIVNSATKPTKWLENNTKIIKPYTDFILSLTAQEDVSFNMVMLANKKLDLIFKKFR